MTDSQCVDYLENICKMFVNGSKNCEHYAKVLELTGSTYYGCDYPFAGVSLCMKPEDFCSRFEQRKD